MRIVLIFLCIIVTSCSNDGAGDEKESIIGKWYYVSDTVDGTRYPYIPGNHDENKNCFIMDDYIEFTDNGDFDQYYFEACQLNKNDKFRYVPSDDAVSIFYKKDGAFYADWKIIELNNEKVIFEFMTDYDNDDILDRVLMEFKR